MNPHIPEYKLEELLLERILVLDGAMGTMIQHAGFSEDDFRGDRFCKHDLPLKGCNDILSITQSEKIADIHRAYLHAGADVIETNTFNANRLSLKDYGLEALAYEINASSARLARIVADEFTRIYPSRPRFVAGSVGPTGKTLSISPDIDDPSYRELDFDDLVNVYEEQIRGLVDGGVHAVLIETVFDTLNAKAALYAAELAFDKSERRVPLMLSVTLSDTSGRTLSGQTLEAFMISVAHAPLMSIGINCAMGAAEMEPWLRIMAEKANCLITIYPNAGLPNDLGGYDEPASEMAAIAERWMKKGWVNLIGGCCGTTPEHIRLLNKAAAECTPRRAMSSKSVTQLSGLEPLIIENGRNFINIGERTNVAGSRKFARLIAEKKYEEALSVARQQADSGAHILDVSMDDGLLDAEKEMAHFLKMLATEPEIARLPVMIDSSRWEVIIAGLKCLQGKAVVNSISLKEGEEKFLEQARMIRRLGAAVVVMAFDEEGQATSFDRKTAICERAYHLLLNKAGFPPEDVYLDPNVLAIATGIEGHDNFALDYIRAVKWIKENLPHAKTSGGISNLSFAFRGHDHIRRAMHAVFLYHAIQAGLDMGIVNAGELPLYDEINPDLRQLTEELVLNRRKDAGERLIMFATQTKESKQDERKPDAWRLLSVEERLQKALINGNTDFLEQDVEEALVKYPETMEIISGPLMSAMEHIGQLFGEGKMFLPQVVKSARVMKKAVDMLMPHIHTQEAIDDVQHYHASIVMATVKGDVHDIGKNITALVMACNNYRIIDMGVMVPPEKIIGETLRQKADMIGLSGLITPSLDEMIRVAEAMEQAGLRIPLLIGGAASSAKHTQLKIAPHYSGPVIHVKDAAGVVKVLNQLSSGKNTQEDLPQKVQDPKGETGYEKVHSKEYLAIDQARKNAFRCDFSQYDLEIPAHTGVFSIVDQPLEPLIPFIDWTFFFNAWDIKGRYPELLNDPVKAQEANKLLADARAMLDEIIQQKLLKARGGFGIFPANAFGDDVVVYSDNFRNQDVATLMFLRNQEKQEGIANYCLADFIGSGGSPDHIGLFALTAGLGVQSTVEEYRTAGDEYRAIMLPLLADRLAEAFAEYLHLKLRKEFWAYDPDENLEAQDLFKGKYRGIRPAPGYPACPDHSEKETIFRLLGLSDDPEISLTETHMMVPVASICGYFFAHPQARYFSTGKIGDDQLEDYKRRKQEKKKHENNGSF